MMKPYADIDFYLTEYGSDKSPSSLFDKYILKASYKIKELTLGKSDLFEESNEYVAWAITDENDKLYVGINSRLNVDLYFQAQHNEDRSSI